MKDTETQILNLGPKLVPPAPQQVLKRLPKQIEQMKDKVAAASRTVTKTIGRQSPLVNKFCQRVEVEIRNRIATEALRDPIFEPAINYFQKMQKHKKIIFRQADKSKVFHADIREKYIEKSTAYMRETNAYIEIPTSPLVKIASFSDKNIPPLFDNHTPYSISNSITFPKHLKECKTTSETNIYTFDITDLYIIITQKEAVLAVCEFLEMMFFLTTKSSCEKMKNILEELNRSDPNIIIHWKGEKSVDYIDITTTIDIPNFKATVYRKLAAQPYILSFHSSHSPHIMRNIPYSAAFRAMRICSHSDDLREELDKIRVMLLLNKYPPTFIDQQMARFYQDLTEKKSSDTLLGKEHKEYRERVLDEQ
ncbi:unnamed protein product [Rotaria sp. Silwood1]|nr:unnamed protein product [Rotaria sp. Silwood1]